MATILTLLAALFSLAAPLPPQEPSRTRLPFSCDARSGARALEDLARAVEAGQIAEPSRRILPVLPVAAPAAAPGCLTSSQILAYEDSRGLLLTSYTGGELLNLLTEAANAMLAAHGDVYDLVGFWTNFDPAVRFGTAFYQPVANEITGIGDPSTLGTPVFNFRPQMGLAGQSIDGFVVMWNINSAWWHGGSGASADFTRLVLGQEVAHRWACYLPDLPGGVQIQGDDNSCGRSLHWNWKLDGQGSSTEISNWTLSNPALPTALGLTYCTEIPGGVWSFPDLYLMGYVSPVEMDQFMSEFRYMRNSDCSSGYTGSITALDSAAIISAAGPRVPDSTVSQKNFRTGWIMIHQPGDSPSAGERAKAVAILGQHQLDWETSTLGRGTISNALFDDCNCNGIPDPQEAPASYCTAGTTASGCQATLSATGQASLSSPSGFVVRASAVEGRKDGIFFYGYAGGQANPWGRGTSFQCVVPPVVRADLMAGTGTTRACDGSFARDFNAWWSTAPPAKVPAASTAVRLQLWFRDPLNTSNQTTSLSDALSFVMCP